MILDNESTQISCFIYTERVCYRLCLTFHILNSLEYIPLLIEWSITTAQLMFPTTSSSYLSLNLLYFMSLGMVRVCPLTKMAEDKYRSLWVWCCTKPLQLPPLHLRGQGCPLFDSTGHTTNADEHLCIRSIFAIAFNGGGWELVLLKLLVLYRFPHHGVLEDDHALSW